MEPLDLNKCFYCPKEARELWSLEGGKTYPLCPSHALQNADVQDKYHVVFVQRFPTKPKCPCTREQDCEACSNRPVMEERVLINTPVVEDVYVTLGSTIGRLVTEKQAAYGDSFGKAGAVMRILYPEGVPPEKLDDALTITRVLDKLFRVATDRDALGESPWRDVAGYALLAAQRTEQGEA